MTAALAAYSERLVEKFSTLELRALSGFRDDAAGLGLDLAASFVQSRLVAGDARRTLADAFAGDPCVVIHGEPGSRRHGWPRAASARAVAARYSPKVVCQKRRSSPTRSSSPA